MPIGIGVALWLTEYGKDSWFANVVRYFVDVMTGVPSIVFGLFIYVVLVLGHVGGTGFAGWKGAIALALLMLPIVVRSAEVVLLLVPVEPARGGARARSAPRWRVITKVVLPTSLSGLVTGSLLAIARGAGETAPLLFTAFGASGADVQPQQPDERAPAADLRRHQVAPQRRGHAGLGGGAYARPDDPLAERDRAICIQKESPGMIPPDTTEQGPDRIRQ